MKTAVVTGVSRGLGLAVAEVFVESGWHTIGVSRSACELSGVQSVQLDVCDEEAVADFFASLANVDVVVNNAGIARSRPLLETPTKELREILEVNVVGAFNVLREAARLMTAQGGGLVINVASDAAKRGISRMAPYAASKHALLGMSRSAGVELRGHKVRVCAYCPGPINTGILGDASRNPKSLRPVDVARNIVHIAELPETMEVQEILVEPTWM